MKVLAAAVGAHENDFAWTVPGELLTISPGTCAHPDNCGCGRSFSGIASLKSTTAGVVVERRLLDVVLAIEGSEYFREWEQVTDARKHLYETAEWFSKCLGDVAEGTLVRASSENAEDGVVWELLWEEDGEQ